MATKIGQIIADYAISKVGCPYIYGGYGENKCTPAFRRACVDRYPDQKRNTYSNCPVLFGQQSSCKGCKYEGKPAYDCAQLTRYCCKEAGIEMVSGATSQWNETRWEKKGTIDTLPDAPGILLYHQSSSNKAKMSHTGVYIGGGEVVDARGAADGTIQGPLSGYAWTHWGALPGVLNGSETAPAAPEEKPDQTPAPEAGSTAAAETAGKAGAFRLSTLRQGSKGTQVRVLQWRLDSEGYECGEVDGIYGSKTKAAVKAYQKAHALDDDGICGPLTWAVVMA